MSAEIDSFYDDSHFDYTQPFIGDVADKERGVWYSKSRVISMSYWRADDFIDLAASLLSPMRITTPLLIKCATMLLGADAR